MPGLWIWLFFGLFSFALATGCGEENEAGTPDDEPFILQNSKPAFAPSTVSQFGYVRITLKNIAMSLNAASPLRVVIGQRNCLLPEASGDHTLSCLAQGHETPGAAPYWLVQDGVREGDSEGLFFSPAVDALFASMAAIGGSTTAGLRSGSLTMDSQLSSPAALLARAAGADFPLPLVLAKGVPETPDISQLNPESGALDMSASWAPLQAYLEGDKEFSELRLDPVLASANFSLPGLKGPGEWMAIPEQDWLVDFYQHLLCGAHDDSFQNTLFETLRSRKPSLIVAGYDFFQMPGWRDAKGFGASVEELESYLDQFLMTLYQQSPPPVLLAFNLPPAELLPHSSDSEWLRYRTIALNNAIYRSFQRINTRLGEPKVFMVDLYTFLLTLTAAQDQVTLFGESWPVETGANGEVNLLITDAKGRTQALGFDALEGIFSLDGETPTLTGSTLLANLLIDTLNQRLGPDSKHPLLASPLDFLSVTEALASDPLSPAALTEQLARLSPARKLADYADAGGLRYLHTAHACAVEWWDLARQGKAACPESLVLENADLVAWRDEAKSLTVHVLDPAYQPLAGYPVGARAKKGVLISDSQITDEKGRAVFSYFAPEDDDSDQVLFVCGSKLINVSLGILEH